MDIDKLIEQLRFAAKLETYYNSGYNGLYNLAATALSTLRAENEKLRADAVRLNDLLASYQNVLVPELRSELEHVKNERDSAKATLHWLKLHGQKEE